MELIYQQGGKNAKSYFIDYFKNNYKGGLPNNIENIINNNKAVSLKNKKDGMFSLIDNELDNDSKKTMKNLHDKFFARIYGQNVKNRISKINESSKAILDKYIELFNKKSKNNTYMNNSNSNSNGNNNGNKNNNSFLNNASVSSNNNNSFLNNASVSSNNNNNPSDLPVATNNKPNDPSNKANNKNSNNNNNNNKPLGLPVAPTNTPNDASSMNSPMNSNMGTNMQSNVSNNGSNNGSNATTLPNNNSSNFEMTANSLKTFEDEDSNLQKKVRHIGVNLEKLSLFSNTIDNAIAKITELNERIALLTSNNGDKQEIAKLSKEKEKLMKLLVNIDGLLNEKTSTMNSKVDRLKTLVEQSNPNATNMVGGKRSKKHRRNMKHKKTMKNYRTRKH